jgi:hypothetical protein
MPWWRRSLCRSGIVTRSSGSPDVRGWRGLNSRSHRHGEEVWVHTTELAGLIRALTCVDAEGMGYAMAADIQAIAIEQR